MGKLCTLQAEGSRLVIERLRIRPVDARDESQKQMFALIQKYFPVVSDRKELIETIAILIGEPVDSVRTWIESHFPEEKVSLLYYMLSVFLETSPRH